MISLNFFNSHPIFTLASFFIFTSTTKTIDYLSDMKNITVILMMLLSISLFGQNDALFKSYAGGADRCYGRAMISYAFDTIEERIVIKPAYTYLEEVPPVYEESTEKILIEPAHTRHEIIPAVYETETVTILVKEAESYVQNDLETDENKLYTTEYETILVKPAHQEWRRTKKISKCKSKNEEDCLEWELIEIPAEYKEIPKKVQRNTGVITPNSTKIINQPAEYKTIQVKKLIKPAEHRTVEVPAKYITVTKYKLLEPRRVKQITVPAEYKTVQKAIVIRDGGVMEAREVLCPELYPRYLTQVQIKLNALGYEAGEVDGVLGKQTKLAIMKYQQDNNLPIGQLDYLTIKKLGLIR